MNTKIIDSTVISVALKTIKSVNLLEKCLERYCVVTSQEVFEEIKIGFKAEILSHYFEKIEIHDLKSNTKYNEIMDYLIRRFPYLHSGELSTFLLILLIYEEENRGYYFVTDDKRMRK